MSTKNIFLEQEHSFEKSLVLFFASEFKWIENAKKNSLVSQIFGSWVCDIAMTTGLTFSDKFSGESFQSLPNQLLETKSVSLCIRIWWSKFFQSALIGSSWFSNPFPPLLPSWFLHPRSQSEGSSFLSHFRLKHHLFRSWHHIFDSPKLPKKAIVFRNDSYSNKGIG